jgi:hypothetical protein
MILELGEKIHVVERRYFTDDVRRHLVGEIVRCTDQVMRLRGYTWIFDIVQGKFVRKPEKRERVIYFGDRMTINVIPPEVALDEIEYVSDPQKGLLATDGKRFSLEITEFTPMR